MTRVWASTDLRCLRFQRVLEKLCLRREAVFPADHLRRDGEAVDEVVHGIDLAAS